MDSLNSNNELGQQPKRSQFLTVLCILTFVFTGFSFLTSIIGFVSGPASPEMMAEQHVQMAEQITKLQEVHADSFVFMFQQLQQMMDDVNNHFYLALSMKIIWVLVGAFGAFQMWNGKKLGFHIYIIYSLLEIAQMYLFTSPSNIPMLVIVYYIIISGIFIILYSRNLKELK
jgi:hypothetical protein